MGSLATNKKQWECNLDLITRLKDKQHHFQTSSVIKICKNGRDFWQIVIYDEMKHMHGGGPEGYPAEFCDIFVNLVKQSNQTPCLSY
jgi:hypothetical protein